MLDRLIKRILRGMRRKKRRLEIKNEGPNLLVPVDEELVRFAIARNEEMRARK